MWVGIKFDNIYTFGGPPDENGKLSTAGFVGSPTSGNDSVILPPWDSKMPRQISHYARTHHYLQTAVSLTLGVTVLLVVGIASWVVIRTYRRSPRNAETVGNGKQWPEP